MTLLVFIHRVFHATRVIVSYVFICMHAVFFLAQHTLRGQRAMDEYESDFASRTIQD